MSLFGYRHNNNNDNNNKNNNSSRGSEDQSKFAQMIIDDEIIDKMRG